jgi:glycosyltransferase involved in cell wall biosynthesis
MKILYVLPSLGTGGAELQTINHVNYLYQHHPEVGIGLAVLGTDLENRLLLDCQHDTERMFLAQMLEQPYICNDAIKKTHKLARWLLGVIKTHQFDVVISVLPIANFITRWAALYGLFSMGKKITLVSYYRASSYAGEKLDTLAKKALNRVSAGLAYMFDKKTIFISKAVYENIRAHMYVRNPLIVPNSLPADVVDKAAALQYLARFPIAWDNKYVMLFPGRLQKYKGHRFFLNYFVEFLAQEETRKQSIVLLLAGDGPLRQELEDFCQQHQLEQTVYFLGAVNNHLMLSLMAFADLMVVPSLIEGFGNVAIEGLKQQALMLVSDSDGLDDIIQDGVNGFKFATENGMELLEKLSTIVDNRADELIPVSNMKQSFEEKYQIDGQIQKILAHIRGEE